MYRKSLHVGRLLTWESVWRPWWQRPVHVYRFHIPSVLSGSLLHLN